jgi:hypothetical protein
MLHSKIFKIFKNLEPTDCHTDEPEYFLRSDAQTKNPCPHFCGAVCAHPTLGGLTTGE